MTLPHPEQTGQALVALGATLDHAASRTTANGYLVVPAVLARTGIVDLGPGERHSFPPEALFSSAALSDWAAQVVTDEHPTLPDGRTIPVTSANARSVAVGFVSGPVAATSDGHLLASLTITDQQSIDAIRSGKRELSIGAFLSRAPSKKKTHDWDVTAVEPNHVALVHRGACGPSCRVSLTTPVVTAGAPAMACTCGSDTKVIDLETRLAAADAARATADAAMQTERARTETALAQLAARDATEGQRIEARIALLSRARAVLGAEYAPPAGASDLVVMSAVVGKILPGMAKSVSDAATAGNAAYVEASYAAAMAVPLAPASTAAAQVSAAAGASPTAPPQTLESMRLALIAAQARRA